ncbi:hypothetical protein CAEBREN_07237 [Caenorhabditis brenneri]|uniref:Uncharacterized protein n=1 Tax=Caenorhabditis brenneri TaxID=135651 RepID=G0MG98_CAEBE|nr:hypothetical protein CAEBREN_07237 [Caenorhabditis brenneri]
MGTRKREIVEFVGLKTYFFPNIALYSECNDELIAKNPEKANRVVSYIFGGTKERPSEQQIVDIILPDNANPETLYTGMDTCLALGGHFMSHFESLVPRLTLLKFTHDLAEVIETGDTKRLHLIGRKARLRKGTASKLLFMLVKIMMAEDNEAKFAHLYDLCEMELEFDALVFIKLLGLENEKNVDDVEEIREMVMQKITPQLKELMIYGAMDELTRLLITYPIEKSAQKLINHRVDLYKHILYAEQEDGYPNADMKKRRLNCQLIFIISRALTAGNLHVAKQMLIWIPASIRREMFPGLQNNRVEKTLEYLDSIIKIFMNATTPISFKAWAVVGINDYLENPWSRRAIVCVLDSFSFAVTHEVFEGLSPPMNPKSSSIYEDSVVVSNMVKSLECAKWIIENYQNFDEKSIQMIQFLNNKIAFVKDVEKALEDSPMTDLSKQIHVEQEQEQKDHVKSSGIVESRSEAVLKTEDFGIVSSPKEYMFKTEDFAITDSLESSKDSDDCKEADDKQETTPEEEDELEKQTKFFTEVASKLTEWDQSVNVKKRDWLEENLDQALPKLQSSKESIAEPKKDVLKLQNANSQNVRVNHNNNIKSSMYRREPPRHENRFRVYTSWSWREAEKPKLPEFTHHDILSSVSGDAKESKMTKNTLDCRKEDKSSQTSPPRPSLNKEKCVLEKKEINDASPESLEDRITRRREEERQKKIFDSPKLTVYDVLAESGDEKKYQGVEKMMPSQQDDKQLYAPYPPVRRAPAIMEELLKLYERPRETPIPVKPPPPVLRNITHCNRPKQPRQPVRRSVNIKAKAVENQEPAPKVDPKSLPRRLFGGVGVGEKPDYSGYI